MAAHDDNWLLYDGECPFCSAYARFVRLRETSIGPLRLIDARHGGPAIERVKSWAWRPARRGRRRLERRPGGRQRPLGRRHGGRHARIGKRLARRETTIGIQFKRAPHPPFEDATTEELQPNLLLVHVQPDEGVSLAIGAKVPGQGMRIRTVHMDFLYGGAFRTELPEAYERLLLDAMLGDQTLFTRSDEVEEQWSLVDAIVAAWARDRPAFPNYAAGTWGPAAVRRADAARRQGVAPTLSTRRSRRRVVGRGRRGRGRRPARSAACARSRRTRRKAPTCGRA